MTHNELRISYETHPTVKRLADLLQFQLEGIALEFDCWREAHIRGPGVYIAVIVGPSIEDFADPMGANRWPSDAPRNALDLSDAFKDALEKLAYTADGAIVVSVDGLVSNQLVRFTSTETPPDITYEDWMGSRHMSALDISTRADVVTTLTLSQESGRVTRFSNGRFESIERTDLGSPYRGESTPGE